MSVTPNNPEFKAACDLLFGSRDEAEAAEAEASPIALAVADAAQHLQQVHEGALDSKRLTDAMKLALSNAVTLHLDSSSSVQSGQRVYSQKDGVCSCPDHQHRQTFCKHLMAAELHSVAQALLKSKAAGEVPKQQQAAPVLPASAAWDVHEAPGSCYLKFRIGFLELSYTMRDVNDETLSARLAKMLPTINAIGDAEEARRQQRAAEQAAAKQAAKQQAAEPADADGLQQMIQQAVKQAMGQTGGQRQRQAASSQNGRRRQASSSQAQQQRQPKYEGEVDADGNMYCEGHDVWMPRRSNGGGSWHSHLLDNGEWCRGVYADEDDADAVPF